MRTVTCLSLACGIGLTLTACVAPPALQQSVLNRPDPAQGPFDFGWQLQGDRAVAPLQVFSGGGGIWLQFADARDAPAIFGLAPDGTEHLLTLQVQAPYIHVAGTWPGLLFRAGHRRARAWRINPHAGGAQAAGPHAAHVPAIAHAQPVDPMPAAISAPVMAAGVPALASTHPAPRVDYAVGPDDVNVRRALVRWARLAGWTFETDHWTLAADIPITAQANLGTDFRHAVSALLESTEMADLPVQPCFYTNRVLRVIAHAQRCDPRSDRQLDTPAADFAGLRRGLQEQRA